jgi:hypothetical protein
MVKLEDITKEHIEKVMTRHMDEMPGFPTNCCLSAAAFLILDLGLTHMDGEYIGPGVKEGHMHNWVYNRETGEFIDPTACQFSAEVPKVLIVKADSKEARQYYSNFTIPKPVSRAVS